MVRSKVLQQANHYSRRYHKGASPKLSHCKKIRLEAGHGTQHSVWRRFAAALLPRLFGKNPRSHHKGATGRFELETNGFQFYAIANLDKTSQYRDNNMLQYKMICNNLFTYIELPADGCDVVSDERLDCVLQQTSSNRRCLHDLHPRTQALSSHSRARSLVPGEEVFGGKTGSAGYGVGNRGLGGRTKEMRSVLNLALAILQHC